MRRLVLLTTTALIAATPAWAAFVTNVGSSDSSFSTAMLAAPTGLTATTSCGGTLSAKVALAWTATSSTFAEGYVLERWSGGVLQSTTQITPRTTVSAQQTGLSVATSYTWRLRAKTQNWTSSEVAVTRTTPTLCL